MPGELEPMEEVRFYLTKKGISNLAILLTDTWRDEQEAHGQKTDSCTLLATWQAFEKAGIVKLNENCTDFEMCQDA